MEWSEPPPARSEGGHGPKYVREANELRAHQGHPAMIEPADPSDTVTEEKAVEALRVKASFIKSGKQAAFRPGGDFDAVVRKRLDAPGYGLWVTYTADFTEGRIK